jgi:hypothetical protein
LRCRARPRYRWLWSIQPGEHPDYAEFKAALYESIDPRFREYFANRPKAIIRLDEIRWGGVRRGGIPEQMCSIPGETVPLNQRAGHQPVKEIS